MQVHIIEGRNFTPQDSSGTSDPFVYVKCNVGEAQRTKTQKKTNSPWFDEVLVFNFENLSREALQEATVTIAVYDEDWFGLAKQMIGSYSFDLLSVYTKNDEHELRRVWVGLTDTEENNEEVAAQGFLKMSCTVIGPNDPLPINDPEQDAKDEAEREKVNCTPHASAGVGRTLHDGVLRSRNCTHLPPSSPCTEGGSNGRGHHPVRTQGHGHIPVYRAVGPPSRGAQHDGKRDPLLESLRQARLCGPW